MTKPNPENCKNRSSKCGYDCAQLNSVHNNATQNSSDNLPCCLQTNIIAQMLSIGGEGVCYRGHTASICVIFSSPHLQRSFCLKSSAVRGRQPSATELFRSLQIVYGIVYGSASRLHHHCLLQSSQHVFLQALVSVTSFPHCCS